MQEIMKQARLAVTELIEIAKIKKNDVLVVGCSSSEVGGEAIGSSSNIDIAEAIFKGIMPILKDRGIFLAAQCCEHLNRAIIIEKELADMRLLEQVNVVPVLKAGGSFATTAYNSFESPVAVEYIRADAGIDIGGTLIGMHLKSVAVPVRLEINKIGSANIIAARTRPRCIGGARSNYDDNLM